MMDVKDLLEISKLLPRIDTIRYRCNQRTFDSLMAKFERIDVFPEHLRFSGVYVDVDNSLADGEFTKR